MDIDKVVKALEAKRSVFHSEADFQFALAWEIQREYPNAEIRLEYPPPNDPQKHIDIFVCENGRVYPIELKYKKKKLVTKIGDEAFHLTQQGAHNLSSYDFIKDIYRVECFSESFPAFHEGYVLWLTNDPIYWSAAKESSDYRDFSTHDRIIEPGELSWKEPSKHTHGAKREYPIPIKRAHMVSWRDYGTSGFKLAIIKIGGALC